MFIRYYLELQLPFDEVERALLADPASWLPGMATEAEDRGERLLVEVGFEVGDVPDPRGRMNCPGRRSR